MSKLEIDACIGSELRDSQGETLSVEGADISDLISGEGRWNDNHGKGFFNSLGRVTEAKKILKAEDAETDREKYYWDKVKSPYIYAKGYLYNDDDDHMNAKAAAAILKNIHKTDAPLKIKASVEGGVMSRGVKDASYLARTKIHSVALTFTPANTATLVEPLNLAKCDTTINEDALMKSVMSLAKKDVPSFIDISDRLRMQRIEKNIRDVNSLVKEMKYNPKLTTGNIERQNEQRSIDRVSAKKPVSAQPVINVSDKPKNDILRTKTGKQFKQDVTFKRHAAKAMKNDGHLNAVINSLTQRGTDKNDINEVVANIKRHMNNPFGMSHEQHADMSIKDNSHLKNHVNKLRQKGISENYINKFIKEVSNHAETKKSMKKAMSAGYAGSGSPMQHTGGSVMQSEAVEGFRYITCDSCGDEQIHIGNQVKCRKCGKNYSLRKLYNMMGA